MSLVYRGFGGRLLRLLLAAFHGAAVGGPVEEVLARLQRLEVLPGSQQRGVVDQRVEQLPATAEPPPSGGLAAPVLRDACKQASSRAIHGLIAN